MEAALVGVPWQLQETHAGPSAPLRLPAAPPQALRVRGNPSGSPTPAPSSGRLAPVLPELRLEGEDRPRGGSAG